MNDPAPAVPGQGLVAVEQQRAIAEVQAALTVARASPRDPIRALDQILTDCQRPQLAEAALYSYSRGGAEVSGPSIRLMECIGRRWGNLECGVRELSRRDGISECASFAWDLESNFRDTKTFHVRHWRDRKGGGGYVLTDERDIYETIANQGARRKRACIQAVVPGDVVEAAVVQCEKTLATTADTGAEAMKKMSTAFSTFGVTREQIEKRIQRRLDAIQPAQVVSLKKIYASLRDGMSAPRDFFEMPQAPAESSDLNERLRAKAESTSKPKPGEPETKPTEPAGGQPPAKTP
jgi:hypothetical protein